MIFYPTESLIYGLFFLAILFTGLRHTYTLLSGMYHEKGYANDVGYNTMVRKAGYYCWLARIFIVLAISMGICSSFLELS